MNAKRALAGTLALGAAAAAATPHVVRRAFEPPRREAPHRPADLGLVTEDCWLTLPSGLRLHGWFVPAATVPAPAVVVLHGWGGSKAHMLPVAPGLSEAGFHVLLLDARNHGESDADRFTSMPRFAEDLEAAVGWLRSRRDVTAVGVVGHSVGAAASIYAAARGVPVDAIVAVSGFAHPRELMERNFRMPRPVVAPLLWLIERMIGHDYDEIAPRHRIVDVDVPVLFVHGADDEVVPVEDSLELHARHPDSRLIVVEDAGHSDLDRFLPVFPEAVRFLVEHLGRA